MSTNNNPVRAALQVMILAPGMKQYLEEHDPMALKQAEEALAMPERASAPQYTRVYPDGSEQEEMTSDDVEREILNDVIDRYSNGFFGKVVDEEGNAVPVQVEVRLTPGAATSWPPTDDAGIPRGYCFACGRPVGETIDDITGDFLGGDGDVPLEERDHR